MLMVLFIFITFAESGKRLSTNEGISLVLLYVFFIMIEFYLELTRGVT
jgi:Ca2+/Na+ antiporter